MASYLFIKRPKFAIVISLAIILAGIISMASLPLEEYPMITPPQVVVNANYPGASADVIEETIAQPIEAQLNGVEKMIYMTSSSQDGSYSLKLYFDIGADPDMAVIHVQNRLQLVTPRLPEMTRRYGLSVDKRVGGPGLLMISINSPNNLYDPLYISNYASIYIKDELARINGVSSVSVFGSADYSMRIWLDAQKMANLGVSTDDVSTAVQNQNTQIAAGEIGVEPLDKKQMIKLTLRTHGRLKDVKEFENIVIKSNAIGGEIKLKDIARIQLGAESYSYFSRLSGQNTAMIVVNQLPEANAIDLVKKIKARIGELSKSLPSGLQYEISRDETDFISESMTEVEHAIVLSIILVVLVTYLFLGTFRASIIPFCAIPVSLLGTFIVISGMGMSINMLVLFGLVLAVGLVVDDAIVVLENAQRHIQQGIEPKEATEITMTEVFSAVVATSLVLMAVFVPICFLPGITGRMYFQFAICIASAIGLSTIVALSLTPALCSTILKNKENFVEKEFLVKFDNWFNKIKEKYLVGAQYFVDNSKLTIKVFLGLLLVILILFKLIPSGFLPDEDRGVMFTQIQLPDGSTASRTDDLTKGIESKIQKYPGVQFTTTLVGMNGENTSIVISTLKPWGERRHRGMDVASLIKRATKDFGTFPGATIVTFSPPAISGLSMFGGLEYQLLDKGNRTPEQLSEEAQKLIATASKDGAFTTVYTQFTPDLPQLILDVNIQKAMAQNVSISEIYNTLSAMFGKSYINDFNKYGRVYRVMMQADNDYRTNQNDIDKIFVKNNEGGMVPLKSVIDIKSTVGPYSLTRFNMYNAVTINASVASGISSGTAMKKMEDISDKVLPKDMGYAWSGTSLQEKESSGQIGWILLLALTFVYLFLVALYESWMLPFGVMLISPVALFGGLLFQYVSGGSLDIYSQIGLIMLVGLSTKQAILIVEFAKEAYAKGKTPQEAAMEAASLRFRAVMMTSIAFILGGLPLVTASGAGCASRHSVGMTVFGGMIAVAFIGTLLVPSFFVIMEKTKMKFSQYKESHKKNN